jgi:hypothetical protein
MENKRDAFPFIGKGQSIHIYIKKNGCMYVCMFRHNSGTPGAISTKLGTHMAICMNKNLMYTLYI